MDNSTLVDEELDPDETDTQTSDKDDADQDDTDDLNDEEIVRRNAARKITSQGQDLRTTDIALLDLIAESPEKAPDIISRIQGENPALARRLSKLFDRREKNALSEKFKDPAIAEAFETLSTQVETLSRDNRELSQKDERRTFRDWKDQQLELDDKGLRSSLKQVLQTVFLDKPLTADLLDDALAIAKRRIHWQDSPTRKAADRIAVEQAKRARLSGSPRGGSGLSTKAPVDADPEMAKMFGSTDPERMKRVADAKSKAKF